MLTFVFTVSTLRHTKLIRYRITGEDGDASPRTGRAYR